MFESTPDPAWEYTPLWDILRKIHQRLGFIETLLLSEQCEFQNEQNDELLHKHFQLLRLLINQSGFDDIENFEPDETLN